MSSIVEKKKQPLVEGAAFLGRAVVLSDRRAVDLDAGGNVMHFILVEEA